MKRTELRLDDETYNKIYDLVYIKKVYRSMNEAYSELIKKSLDPPQ